ncbi:MAG: hypothetical protein J6D26_05965 [Clostridia bacterium]|nr:hypothetical protein [Clostridia bacterium]
MNKRLKIACIAAAVIAVIVAACYFAPVRSIKVRDLSKEEIYVGEDCGFIIDVSGGIFTDIRSLRIVSDNPEIADIKCSMEGLSVIRYPVISITPKAEGTMKFHIETKDGKVKSNTTEITVTKNISK